MGGDNSLENLTLLTYRERFICHWLLTKMIDNEYKFKLYNAFYCMTMFSNSNKRIVSSKQFELTRKYNSEAKKGKLNPFYGKTHSDEFKKLQSERKRNRIVTDETRKKLSILQKGKPKPPKTEEHKNKIKQSHIGRKWWNNGIVSKFQKERPDDNFILGRLRT